MTTANVTVAGDFRPIGPTGEGAKLGHEASMDIVKSGLKGLMPLPPPIYIMVRSLKLIHSTLSAYMKMNSLRFEDLTLKCKDVARKKQILTVLIFIWV